MDMSGITLGQAAEEGKRPHFMQSVLMWYLRRVARLDGGVAERGLGGQVGGLKQVPAVPDTAGRAVLTGWVVHEVGEDVEDGYADHDGGGPQGLEGAPVPLVLVPGPA